MNFNREFLRSSGAFVLNNIVWFLFAFSVIIMGVIEPIFFSFQILTNIVVQSAVLGILTCALSFIILLGEIDLSLAGIMGIAAGMGTIAVNRGLPWPLAVVTMILIGALFGLINGLFVAKLKAVSLIETLAMNITLTGAMIAVTKGRSILGLPDSYKFIGQGMLRLGSFQFPVLPLIFIIVYVLAGLVWSRTVFGRSLFAVGGNARTALVSGINVARITISAFVIAGVMAGFSGYLISAYLGAFTVSIGGNFTMNSIAAAVIGGTSLSGGIGRISGILGGVLLLTVIQVGLQILGISSFYVEMSGGLMILLAVLIDSIRLRIIH